MCLRSHGSVGLTPSGQTPHTQLGFQGWPFLLTPKQPPPVRSDQGNPWASPEESPCHPEGKAAGREKLRGKEARDPSGGKQGIEVGAGWGWGV